LVEINSLAIKKVVVEKVDGRKERQRAADVWDGQVGWSGKQRQKM